MLRPTLLPAGPTKTSVAAAAALPAACAVELPEELLADILQRCGSRTNAHAACVAPAWRQAAERSDGKLAQHHLRQALQVPASGRLDVAAMVAQIRGRPKALHAVELHLRGASSIDAAELLALLEACQQAPKLQRLRLPPVRLDHLSEAELQDPTQPLNRALAALAALPQLQRLDLSTCGLRAVPVGLLALRQLEVLDLSHNCIDALPAEISCLHNLRRLHLSLNRFAGAAPVSLAELPQLAEVFFTHNQLNSLGALHARRPQLRISALNNPELPRPHFV